MRYFVPTFRQLLIAGLCVSTLLAAGCARQPAKPRGKPAALLVDKGINAPKNEKKPLMDEPKPPAPPKLIVDQGGVTLSWSDKAGRTMVAKAKSDSYSLRTQIGTLLDFSAKLYENGALLASMKAPHAYVDTGKRFVVATGGVDLQFAKPQTKVRSAWIKWSPDKHKIVGNGGVTMTYPNGTVHAAAFVGDTEKQTLELRDSGKGLD
jgi:hypothetical protein